MASSSGRDRALAMRSRLWLQLFFLHLIGQGSVCAQSPDEYSIPEPTELSAIASSENSSIERVGNHALVAGRDTLAEVAAVRFEEPGKDGKKGRQLVMTEGDTTDRVLLDLIQATELMEELYGFQSVYRGGNTCTAREMCIRGVARCRPSQTETQAICPGYYSRPDGSQGILISTPRHTFDFPYVEPAVLAEAIVVGIGWHNSLQHRRERRE